MNKESFHAGIPFIILSAVSVAVVGLFGKIGSQTFTFSALVFWRFFSAFILFILLLFFLGQFRKRFSISHIKLSFFRAFFTLGAQGSFYYYIQTNTILNGMVLLNTGPLFIPLIEWGILRHRVGKSTWIGVIISFIGVICVIQPDAGIFQLVSFVGLFAGVSQGISQILFGYASREEHPQFGILSLFFFCSLIALVPYLFSESTFQPEKGFDGWALALTAILGSFSILNQTSRAAGYLRSTPTRLSPFLYFGVPVAGLFDWLIFDQTPNFLSVIGTILVIGGGLLKVYLRHKILSQK